MLNKMGCHAQQNGLSCSTKWAVMLHNKNCHPERSEGPALPFLFTLAPLQEKGLSS
jgi:hypothetical protein